ncbi:hypothetical protein AIOL_000094 [Candidatus Rhodobacter oscarellae]|uniref:Uncharacterized protein n=1 Tax=Candidatus Rhodobacter oscarellae TaxID=1675527 RepID=A0A0J9EAY4_9RHOB|nr:hypothetical protein [Candidatus Rhodobacter lobularis]KMW59945.1 hypothetical protein AIOL_000094 [Candidatus Rhodobacter lobularis]
MTQIEQSNFDLKEEIRAYWSARSEDFDESPSHRIETVMGFRNGSPFYDKPQG